MSKFPSSKEEVNVWLTNLLNEEEGKSAEAIRQFVQQNEVDGKLLVLLYKHPNELPQLIPNLRARLLFMNALDVLIKNTGKDIPINLISAELPSESLLSRAPFSNDHSVPHFAIAGSSVDEKRAEDPDDSISNMGEMSHSGGTTSHHDQQLEVGDYGDEDSATGEIPFPVPLPIFDHSLQQAIDAGRVRERCIRSRIANACARFYINFKMYPNQVDYHRICDRLIQKYPDLRDGEMRLGVQPWRHLKKLLSMAFCNVRRIMKNKDLTNARHIISNIQKRYRGFGRETGRRMGPSPRKQQNRSFSPLSSSSEEGSLESNASRNRTIPNPPPIPMFETDMQRAIVCCKLKERPYSSQFYRICAKFYTKMKKYPSRKDYKNISTHLAKVFPDLGLQSQVKHMLSQYIRSLRQSRKLLKLDRMQKARMLTMGMPGNKVYGSRHGYTDASTSNPNGSAAAGQDYQFAVYEFPTSVTPREGQQSTLNPGFFSSFASDTSAPSTSSRPTSAPTPQTMTEQGKTSASGATNQFPLPPLDEAMCKGIREGQLHDKTFRHKFIRHCAAFYISLKSYPTKEDYNMICRTVVTEFLDLRDPTPLPGCPPFLLFKKALTSCIRNKRRDLLSPVGNESHGGGGGGLGGRQPRRSRSSKSKSQRNSSNYNQNTQMLGFRDQLGLSMQTENSVVVYDHVGRGRSQGEGGLYLQHGPAEPFDGGQSQQGHIPYPVPIPVFTTDLMMLLDTGQPVIADARNAFLQTCAEFYLRMKLYLSKADFSAICAQLVQTFPQLADPGSVPGRMGSINLKKELSAHFVGYQQRIKSVPGSSKDIKNIPSIVGGVNPLAVVPTSMANNNPCPSGQQLLPFHSLPSHPYHHHHPVPVPAPASFDRRGTEQQYTDIPITYPAPLPRFPRIIQQAIHQGYRLEGQARSRLLQVCAKFYTEIKYHPTRADYHNICTTLLEAIPVLGGLTVPADKAQDLRRVKKELSLHIRSLRRNCKVNGLPIPTSAPPIQWWYANATFPSVSAFNEYFNKTPTHEDVERNITHLKEIINELV